MRLTMNTGKHIHEETFDADAETIFNLLVTPSVIRQWWGASHAIVDKKEGGVWDRPVGRRGRAGLRHVQSHARF